MNNTMKMKPNLLASLVNCKTDAERQNLKKVIHVVKQLRKEGIDYRSLSMIYMTIIRDFFQQAFKIQTHLEVDVFRSLIMQKLKLPLDSTLCEQVCAICMEAELTEGREMISMKKLQFLVDLY